MKTRLLFSMAIVATLLAPSTAFAWSAVAIPSEGWPIALTWGHPNQQDAVNSAMKKCNETGIFGCNVVKVSEHGCLALAVGTITNDIRPTAYAGGNNLDETKELAIRKCSSGGGVNCSIVESGCNSRRPTNQESNLTESTHDATAKTEQGVTADTEQAKQISNSVGMTLTKAECIAGIDAEITVIQKEYMKELVLGNNISAKYTKIFIDIKARKESCNVIEQAEKNELLPLLPMAESSIPSAGTCTKFTVVDDTRGREYSFAWKWLTMTITNNCDYQISAIWNYNSNAAESDMPPDVQYFYSDVVTVSAGETSSGFDVGNLPRQVEVDGETCSQYTDGSIQKRAGYQDCEGIDQTNSKEIDTKSAEAKDSTIYLKNGLLPLLPMPLSAEVWRSIPQPIE